MLPQLLKEIRMIGDQISEVVNRELQAFVANPSIDPCWRQLASDLQALRLPAYGPITVLIRPNGEFISFVFDSWQRETPEVRIEDDQALLTEALFYGISETPSLQILCPSVPSNAVVCWQCRGSGKLDVVDESCTCRGLGWLPPNRHLDPKTVLIACSGPAMIRDAINEAREKISPEFRKRLAKVERQFISFKLSGYDLEGLYQRMNNRSVAQILAESDLEPQPTPIASGQIGGVKYELYDSPVSKNA